MTNDEAREAIDRGIALLREARDLFHAAQCPKTTARIRAAISSANGAARAAAHREYRDARKAARAKHE